MLSHFFSFKNTLQLVWPNHFLEKLQRIGITGFSTFFTDMAMGILTILFNRQIMKYLGTNALAVYAVIINISTFVQCCAYSVGQAAQPIISVNFGVDKGDRILKTLKYALWTTAFFIFLDGIEPDCSKSLHSNFHDPHPRSFSHRSFYYSYLCVVIFVVAF